MNIPANVNLSQSNSKFWDRCAIFLFFIFFSIYTTILSLKFYNFAYHDWDLATYTQAMYSFMSGNQYVSLAGVNFFGNHSCFIMFFLLPIFYVIPSALTLEFLKIISFCLAALFFYKIVKEHLGGLGGFLFMLAYLIFPANIFAVAFDFTPESFTPLCLFGMLYSFEKNDLAKFLICGILLMLIKENLTLVFATFGLYALIFPTQKNKIIWGWMPFLGGIALFLLLTFWFIPHSLGSKVYPFVNRYQHLGHTLPEIAGTLIHRPMLLWHSIFSLQNIFYIKQLFGGLLIPAFFSPNYLFLFSPLLLQHLLSESIPEHTIFYHYGFSLTPFIFFAAYKTFHSWAKFFRSLKFLCLVIVFSIAYMFHFLEFTNAFKEEFTVDTDNKLSAYYWNMVSRIPKNAGVIATFNFLPALANHQRLFSFHKNFADDYQDPNHIVYNVFNQTGVFVTPPDVQYALIDFKDAWVYNSLKLQPQKFFERIAQSFKPEEWKIALMAGDAVLLTRDGRPDSNSQNLFLAQFKKISKSGIK